MKQQDTIAAVATPPGTGGVAIIRISGENAQQVLRKVFSREKAYEHAKLYYGRIEKNDILLDEAMAVLFYKPASYTGEDVAELHCHGSALGVSRILSYVCECGARPAQPGEFTKRAFLNGKMDLTQAEAVGDYISAMNEAAAKASMKQLEGNLRQQILTCQDTLTDILARVEAAVEYPEEDMEQEISIDCRPALENLKKNLEHLIGTFNAGKILRHGLDVVIAGKPNVGKSSLLNALLAADRAIVAEVPGTTRDTVEHPLIINGIQINLKDTAGIRRSNDIIEEEGIKRAKRAINDSDLILFMLDAVTGLEEEDRLACEALKENLDRVLVVWNKIDASERRTEIDFEEAFTAKSVIKISAKTGEGLDKLKQRIYELAEMDERMQQDVIITNERHLHLLQTAAGNLEDALGALECGVDMDCVTIDLNAAWNALGEITGNTVSEEIIDRIFEKFCLGK